MTDRQGTPIRKDLTVPDDFADTLRALHASDPQRLPSVLLAARAEGWTLKALAAPLGMSGEWVRLQALVGDPHANMQGIPPLPCRPVVERPPAKVQKFVDPTVAARLLEMYEIAKTVTGGTPVDDPKRAVTVEFTTQLQALVDDGVTVYRIAKTLGITHSAIYQRLARHGHRKLSATTSLSGYKGRPHPWRPASIDGLREIARGDLG